jgi:hypothetical protein
MPSWWRVPVVVLHVRRPCARATERGRKAITCSSSSSGLAVRRYWKKLITSIEPSPLLFTCRWKVKSNGWSSSIVLSFRTNSTTHRRSTVRSCKIPPVPSPRSLLPSVRTGDDEVAEPGCQLVFPLNLLSGKEDDPCHSIKLTNAVQACFTSEGKYPCRSVSFRTTRDK